MEHTEMNAIDYHRVLAIIAVVLIELCLQAGPPDAEKLAAGKELFTREWVHGDKRSHAGDGLGPVYNAQSCAACHKLGGVGGAGGDESNVTIVTAFVIRQTRARDSSNPCDFFSVPGHLETLPPPEKRSASADLNLPTPVALAEIHPDLLRHTSFRLHRFGVDPGFKKWRSDLFSDSPEYASKPTRFHLIRGMTLVSSRRNPPAQFGA
jgi:Di-haem oxidoreductase, putative peroxidase